MEDAKTSVGELWVYERELRVAVRARERGGYTYQIFTVASEPRTLVGAKNDRSYASPAEAERAGFEAAAVLKCIIPFPYQSDLAM
jgi:hypothetical protein